MIGAVSQTSPPEVKQMSGERGCSGGSDRLLIPALFLLQNNSNHIKADGKAYFNRAGASWMQIEVGLGRKVTSPVIEERTQRGK